MCPITCKMPSILGADRRIDCFMHAGPLRDSGIAPALRNFKSGLVNARYAVGMYCCSCSFVGGGGIGFVMLRINRLSDR